MYKTRSTHLLYTSGVYLCTILYFKVHNSVIYIGHQSLEGQKVFIQANVLEESKLLHIKAIPSKMKLHENICVS